MYLKHNFVTNFLIFSCICAFCCTEITATHCSLDRMKKFAMQACEHILEFEPLEVRDRRSIYSGYIKNQNTIESPKYAHFLRRSIYPMGGYLKVGDDHYKKLSEVKVSPRYKAQKPQHLLQPADKKKRYKREDRSSHRDSSRNNISYCCYHKCDEEFFC